MKKAKEEKDYYVGLDMGTDGTGWAAADPKYALLKFNGKSMWGIRLFDQAKTAKDRRLKRTNRRRLQRRVQRIKLLQDLFKDEIAKVDPTFFIQLNESSRYMDDKSANAQLKYPLFNDPGYTDIDYYKQYPTIFHLRKELIESSKPHDIRLVYLAIHNILKHRGHFLIEGGMSGAGDFKTVFDKLVDAIENGLDIPLAVKDESSMEAILKDKGKSNNDKAKELVNCLALDNASCSDKKEKKEKETALKAIINLIVGHKRDIRKIFIAEDLSGMEKTSFSLTSNDYEENIRPELEAIEPDDCDILDSIKAVYDWSILVHILGNEKHLSFGMVKLYEEHQKNLKILKRLMKKYYDPKKYNDFFHSKGKRYGYGAYVGNLDADGLKASAVGYPETEFYKALKNILETFEGKVQPKDQGTYKAICTAVENRNLLPLQRSKDNGAIPKQLHEEELKLILKNAATYLPFLDDKCPDGLTPAEKILDIFNFRVPYYVGPLSTRHQSKGANVWIERKEEGRIYPSNFSDKVDEEKTGEKFISRMTNKCTYIVGEDVIPKRSLLYSSFMVLNELNKLKIRGRAIKVPQKQAIYNDLFMKKNKVTGKQLLAYLQQDDPSLEIEDLSGFDKDFKSSLSPYLDFEKKVFGKKICDDKEKKLAEDIIRYKTIYGDGSEKSWKMIKNVLSSEHSGELTDDQLKAIKNLGYNGWGGLSKRFLNEIRGTEKSTGKKFTIIRALWETNCNLMELLSGKFTFAEEIEKINLSSQGAITEITYDSVVKDLYLSPAVKRSVWQTIQIVEEIKKVMGCAPKKIFVEVPRGGGKKEKTKSRKEKLKELYKDCKTIIRNLGVDWDDLYKNVENTEESKLKSRKLYLYYLQMGRCMYTGEPIDLGRLMNGNSEWDIDHIYPQSKVKDDSLDNIVLSKKTYNSNVKGDKIVPSSERNARKAWWKTLQEKGFISKEKYDRLTRETEFSSYELGGFINRQLVETRQSTKAVIELLKRLYGKDTQVIPVEAGTVSDFRKNDLNMLKSRLVNDYHHAKDAYLNIVVGDVYSTKFTLNPVQWIEDEQKKGKLEYSLNHVFDYDVYRGGEKIWTAPDDNGKKKNAAGEKVGGTLEEIRITMRRNDILYTEYTYCDKGKLFDETIARKSASLIPLKKGQDTSKYGGYKGVKTSYFALVEFDGKKGKREKIILEVPIYVDNMLSYNKNAYIEYCEDVRGLKNVKIIRPCIKMNSLLEVDGYPMRLTGYSGNNLLVKNSIQPVLHKREDTIRKIEKYFNKVKDIPKKKDWPEVDEKFDGIKSEELLELYDDIVDKLATTYQQRPANPRDSLGKEQRDKFKGLNLTEKTDVVHEMMKLVRCDGTTTADLHLICDGKEIGRMRISKSTIAKKKVALVNQSVAGLFERREDLT